MKANESAAPAFEGQRSNARARSINAPSSSPVRWPVWLAPELVDLDGPAVGPFPASRPITEDGRIFLVPTPGHVEGHVSVVVRDDDQVRDVTTELLAASRPGLVIAIHSTIKASTAIALAEVAEPLGVHIVDAPISGGAMGAHAGTLAVMVGGEAGAVELCRPVFGHFASLVSHLGPVGSGTRAKLARNLLHFVAFTAVGEAQRLAEAAGIPVAELGKIVRQSDSVTGGPGAIMLRDSAGPLAPGDDWYPVMENVASLGAKDLQQALELAAELGVDTPLASMALQRLALELGLPEGSGT